eukprot:1854800-Pleurochrysis_carterae.AAC.1
MPLYSPSPPTPFSLRVDRRSVYAVYGRSPLIVAPHLTRKGSASPSGAVTALGAHAFAFS